VTAPLRIAATSTLLAIDATTSILGAAAGTAVDAGEAATGLGKALAGAAPDVGALARAAAGMAIEACGGPPMRRTSVNGSRYWLEVRGLEGENGSALADDVLAVLRATPSVREASLNSAVSRVVVKVDDDGPSPQELCRLVSDAERRTGATGKRRQATSLPGDDEVLVARAAAAAVAVAGLGLAVTGSVLRLPGLLSVLSVPPTMLDHIPRLRREIERRVGPDATDLLFAAANSTTAALAVSPTSAFAEAANRAMLAAEAWNARRAWQLHEPELARHTSSSGASRVSADTTAVEGSADRYANRAGAVGIGAAAVLGALSRNIDLAARAALVAAPKPVRHSREAFGCALTRGLSSRHDALVVRPRALRILDRIDAIVIDPRALYTDELMVSRIRGVENARRTQAWDAARAALDDGGLSPGWHPLAGIPNAGDAGEALVSPVRHPFASAVVAEARRTKVRVVSIDDDGLRSLAQGFDHLHRIDGSVDRAVADAVAALTAEGTTVALLTTSRMRAAHAAHLTIGLLHPQHPPPWGADVFVPDLAGAWRLLHALPAARKVSDRAIQLSAATSLIGALMLIPGVVGRGPASVNAGAAAGLWTGFSTGGKVFRDALPNPEPGHDWHALPASEVRRLLPRPTTDEPEPSTQRGIAVVADAPPARLVRTVAAGSWRTARDFVAEMRTNLDDPITPLLATGAVASALLGSPLDAALVTGVLLANASLSAQQQLHAERVLRRLLAVQEPPARRCVGPLDEHRHEKVPANRLRPGDVIRVHAGEVIPADARLIDASNIEVDESALTGESLPVAKHTTPTPGAPLAERACMLYGGTTMVAGTGMAVVTAVGPGSEMRRAMAMAPRKSREIGLHTQLRRITRRALPVSVGGGALVGALSIARGTPLRQAIATGVALVVAAVPEGLPLVVTLAQLAAARKLSNKSVLIRNPNSVEAFARLDVVCFDKTGTLSENRLQVKSVRPLAGFSPGNVLDKAARTTFARPGHRADHATDQAVRETAEAEFGAVPVERDAFLPFQSGRPFAAALRGNVLAIKGAPEVVWSALTDDDEQLANMIDEMAANGLRVLAVAERHLDAEQAARAVADSAVLEEFCRAQLTPIGVLGLADTPRPSARALLQELSDRDIGVRLITGDHPVTAGAVANELGLYVTPDEILTGTEWEMLSAEERAKAVTTRRVFARMTPEHKIAVVQTLERTGLVTAMVGDGANDAAAIRAASVGVGVVARGSDPARVAADVMLLDGRIEALLDGLDEGHQLWRRVYSSVSVLLGGNAGEVCFALITSLLTGRSVLNARQMLLVNMLTDALPAAALAVSDQIGTAVAERDETVLWREIAIRGVATTSGATVAWLVARPIGTARRASTVALIGLVGAQLMQTLVDSHGRLVVLTTFGSLAVMVGVVSTPGLSQLFGCTPVGPIGWGQGFVAAGAATALSAFAAEMLSRVAESVQERVSSVVDDDDDAGPNEHGVDIAEWRGQQPDGAAEQRILSETTKQVPHDSGS